jgi:DNA polymerase I-like protein with 3'-5' exonuclease and polymerase domains/uracil-DNA glycosylase
MGHLFTALEAPLPDQKRTTSSVNMMHQLGCRICPRANQSCRTPQMKPSGSREPLVYMLGLQPDREDDEDDAQFSPDSRGGRLLRAYMPEDVEPSDIRWNYIVRTRGDGTPPTPAMIECCRKSIEQDIIESQPVAIWGFGDTVLKWVRPGQRIADLRGRRFPVRFGDFVTWYYCFDDPGLLRQPVKTKWGWKVDPERERSFRFDLRRAVNLMEYGDEPEHHTNSQAFAGIEVITRQSGGLARVLEILKEASQQDVIGYDYETSKIRPYEQRHAAIKPMILSLGLAWGDKSYAFGLNHRQAGWSPAELRKIEDGITELLMSPAGKAAHNLAFELEWTGVKFGHQYIRDNNWEDSLSQAFILDERTGGRKQKNGPASLHFHCLLHFGVPLKDLSPEIDSNSKKDMAAQPLAAILPYNALDAKYHLKTYFSQMKQLQREQLVDAYRMKVRQVQTVSLTQIKGAPIDADENQRFYEIYAPRVAEAEKEIVKSPHYKAFQLKTNRFFNPASDPDMQIMLKDIVKANIEVDKDGNISTEREVLEKVRDPIIKPILAHRRASKALSTYVLPLRPDSEDNYDGTIHTILNTTVARTGRLSSEAPNIQNFPVRDPEMGKVRAQIADKIDGKLVMKVDYGQIEARVIAMVSRDAAFVKALWERYDIHMAWALKIYEAAPYVLKRWPQGDDYPTMDKRMKALRTAVKNEWTFPLFFGAQLSGVARFLEVQERDLIDLRDEWWDTFKGVKAWQEKLKAEYRETNEITYITGRKARGPISENQLFNYPIQGPTCDIIMNAMDRVSRRSLDDWNYQPIFQIHDDLTFLLPEKGIEDYADNIISDMLAVPFDFVNVPITLEVAIGPNWHDVHSEGDFSSDNWKMAA